jgi:CRISPR-associated endonuclease Cas1 subtype II
MSWRTIVVSEVAKLDYQIGYLVVRGNETIRVHIQDIETLIVENTAISLTTYLLSELVKNKVKVIFCDERRNPSSELLPYYGSHDTSAKIREQIKWDNEKKSAIWTDIITEKIKNQAMLLKNLNKSEYELLYQYISEIEFGDATNREGHAAKVYFNALFGKKFTRDEENSINAALNYGYSLLLSSFSRIVVANGYITQIGLFHDNTFNQFNLASDLMEPFRPLVDEKVYNMMPEVFGKEQKHILIQILQDEVQINGRKEYLTNAMQIYSRSVFDSLNNSDPGKLRFYSR